MRLRISWSSAAVAGAMILLPFKAGGCGRSACFTFSKASHDAMGSCPSAADAMARFNGPCGSGAISAVQGDGAFDGEFCCYDVVQDDSFAGDCFGGFGGGVDVGGVGGVGGSPPCITCGVAASEGVFAPLCGGLSQSLWSDLQSCGCDLCADACSQSICIDLPVDMSCAPCLQTSCGTEIVDCSNDI